MLNWKLQKENLPTEYNIQNQDKCNMQKPFISAICHLNMLKKRLQPQHATIKVLPKCLQTAAS